MPDSGRSGEKGRRVKKAMPLLFATLNQFKCAFIGGVLEQRRSRALSERHPLACGLYECDCFYPAAVCFGMSIRDPLVMSREMGER